MNKLTCTKRYDDFPAAHRAPKHDGHCRLIHGHNFSFEFEFETTKLDANGFVVDFGKLKGLKEELNSLFDHTCLIDKDDPEMGLFRELHEKGLLQLTVCSGGTSAENLARLAISAARPFLPEGARVVRVTCFEDSKNSATAYSTLHLPLPDEQV